MIINKNQFSDHGFIKETVRELMQLPAEKFIDRTRNKTDNKTDFEYIAEKINNSFRIDLESCMKMNLGEFTTMINALKKYSEMFYTAEKSDDEGRYYTRLMRKMFMANRQLPEIQLYNAIDINAYFKHLDLICMSSNTGQAKYNRKVIGKIHSIISKKMQDKTDITLGETLEFFDKKSFLFWMPWCENINDFARFIRETYDIIWWLIKDASDILLPQTYVARDIVNKYNGDSSFMDSPFDNNETMFDDIFI
ncbi:MAG: hypothetical protein ACI4JA_03520 [Oscillospiraceae bacterium]